LASPFDAFSSKRALQRRCDDCGRGHELDILWILAETVFSSYFFRIFLMTDLSDMLVISNTLSISWR
jgi:hypothetical protein